MSFSHGCVVSLHKSRALQPGIYKSIWAASLHKSNGLCTLTTVQEHSAHRLGGVFDSTANFVSSLHPPDTD